MIGKVLIANRGEIALRVMHACRELGIPTVAVYSTADRHSRHVAEADQSVCIGPPAASDSYLDASRILASAEITGADAVHPGYGFLAENANFAELLTECGLTWIGPRPETIRLMGDKAQARRVAREAGVPVLPGSDTVLADVAQAEAIAQDIGFPVILKAAAGGGGRGMRLVARPDEVKGQFLTARQEALKAFSDGGLYLEKYLTRPRHIEVQVFGDGAGGVLHFGDRECSIQRRHQKLLEEAPAPGLAPATRKEIAAAAVRLARRVGYANAGTVEFLADEDGRFYFMEMNTRIQVEHPVTEAIWGVDLVKLQIRTAAGERLDLNSGHEPRGHAIECRINAEDPESFMPSPGLITRYRPATGAGIRVDSHAYEGYRFPPFYDSLIGKVIAFGADRDEAIARMSRALRSMEIDGIRTTLPLHRRLLEHAEFRSGRISTQFLDGLSESPREAPV